MSKRRRVNLPAGEGTVFLSAQYPRTLTVAPGGDNHVLFEIDENPRFADAAAASAQFPVAQVPLIMSAMFACTGKFPTELTRIAHEKGFLGRPAVETRQSRRAAARKPPGSQVSEYNYKDTGEKPRIPETGFFEFTDPKFGDILKVAPFTEGGKWRIEVTITSGGRSASAQFKALDVIPIFVAAGTHTGRDSQSLGEEAVREGYMSNRRSELSRAERRAMGRRRRPAAGAKKNGAGLEGLLEAQVGVRKSQDRVLPVLLSAGRGAVPASFAGAPGLAGASFRKAQHH